jgi:hypothetical protein
MTEPVISVAPSRRAALLLSGSGLIGGAFGPLMASLLVSPAGAGGPLAVAALMMLLALILLGILVVRSVRRGQELRSGGAEVSASPGQSDPSGARSV